MTPYRNWGETIRDVTKGNRKRRGSQYEDEGEERKRFKKKKSVYIVWRQGSFSLPETLPRIWRNNNTTRYFLSLLKFFCVPFSRFSTKKTTAFEFLIGSSHIPRTTATQTLANIRKGKEEDRWIRWKIQKGIKSGSFLESSTLSRPILLHATSAYSASTYKRVERAT